MEGAQTCPRDLHPSLSCRLLFLAIDNLRISPFITSGSREIAFGKGPGFPALVDYRNYVVTTQKSCYKYTLMLYKSRENKAWKLLEQLNEITIFSSLYGKQKAY